MCQKRDCLFQKIYIEPEEGKNMQNKIKKNRRVTEQTISLDRKVDSSVVTQEILGQNHPILLTLPRINHSLCLGILKKSVKSKTV